MKNIHVLYFALLREQRGVSEEQLATVAETPGELYSELRRQHGFTLECDRLRVVVNEAFSHWDAELNAGDTVVFIPPVAGG